jgi:hypothetical protein
VSEEKWKSKVTPAVTDVDRTPVAQDIWCYSAREKAFTWHVVMNHDAQGYVDRVQCKVTGSIHKYKRQNKPAAARAKPSAPRVIRRTADGKVVGSSPASSRTVSREAETSATIEQTWFAGVKAWGDKVVSSYAPDKYYLVGDVVEHASFGKGVVQARRDNKVDVLFRTALKTLPSARKPQSTSSVS